MLKGILLSINMTSGNFDEKHYLNKILNLYPICSVVVRGIKMTLPGHEELQEKH